MTTEGTDSSFDDLDLRRTGDIVRSMWAGQLHAVRAVDAALPAIAAAADAAAGVLAQGGRLVYAGAGTSARIAVQDGVELAPTFGWPQQRLDFAIAGGKPALAESVEGAEDDAREGTRRIRELAVGPSDVVIAVTASGSTPYTLAAVRTATDLGATTIAVANNAASPVLAAARHPIVVESGSEVIAGSTRMNAGTAQKVVLNLLSSTMMIRLGRVYGGYMVGMRATNAKLRRRAAAIVDRISACGTASAVDALAAADGDIRLAALLASGVPMDAAQGALSAAAGNLRMARRALGLEAP
jgi:N-acetylmuramic acid 6-phosphate etherase